MAEMTAAERHRHQWTDTDDSLLLEGNWLTADERARQTLAATLGRTVQACEQRWNFLQEVERQVRDRMRALLPEGGRQVATLAALSDRIDLLTEAVRELADKIDPPQKRSAVDRLRGS